MLVVKIVLMDTTEYGSVNKIDPLYTKIMVPILRHNIQLLKAQSQTL